MSILTVPSKILEKMTEKELRAGLDERTKNEVERIEWVFSKSPQLRPYKEEYKPFHFDTDLLRMLYDPSFEPSHAQLEEFSQEQLLAIHIAQDPVTWGKAMLGLRPRAYQTIMLRWPYDQKVLRLGRRLGKTWTLALKGLWHAYTHPQSPVLVVAPMKSHVELIYREILRMARQNEVVADSITRAVTSPQFSIELENGSIIRFFTSGIRSGGRADVARGQEAHLIVLDEADLLHLDDLNALYAMMQQTSEVIVEKEFWASSTPTGRRELFWEWAHSDEFKEFWFPSLCNPYYDKKTDRRFRKMFSEIGYEHEVLAVWGEAAEGVFPPRLVDPAISEREYLHISLPAEHGIVTMGVDWGKYTGGTHIVVCDYFPPDHNKISLREKVRFLNKAIIPKSEFTLSLALEKIIQWNELYDPKHIYVDKGFGEKQVEDLVIYGKMHPNTKLHRRVKAIAFGGSIEVFSPLGVEKKEMKPFMVDCARRFFEERQVVIPKDEEELYKQLLAYMVVRTTQLGRPIFEAVNAEDHLLDAFMLALLAVAVEILGWTHPIQMASKTKPIQAGSLSNLVRAPENEDEEVEAEVLKNKGYGIAVNRSFTPHFRRPSSTPYKRRAI